MYTDSKTEARYLEALERVRGGEKETFLQSEREDHQKMEGGDE